MGKYSWVRMGDEDRREDLELSTAHLASHIHTSQGLFINAACFDRIEYNPLSGESDPGINVYRLVRPLPQGEINGEDDHSGDNVI